MTTKATGFHSKFLELNFRTKFPLRDSQKWVEIMPTKDRKPRTVRFRLGNWKMLKKRRSTGGSSQKAKRTRNQNLQIEEESNQKTVEENKEKDKLTDSSQTEKETERELPSETMEVGIKENRSRSRSPDGVDHRPKPKEMEQRTPVKGSKRRLNFKNDELSPVRDRTPQKKFSKRSSRGGASNDEMTDGDGESERDTDLDSSEESMLDRSLSESVSSLSDDERSFKRIRKYSRSRSRTPKGREKTRSRSRSESEPQRKKKKKKRSKKGKRMEDVQSIVDQALEKQRIQMQEYFAKLHGNTDKKEQGKGATLLKSPSDTDIYAPAVKRANDNLADSPTIRLINQAAKGKNTGGQSDGEAQDNINDFIKSIRDNLNFFRW